LVQLHDQGNTELSDDWIQGSRSRFRLGINECLRAFVRGELSHLVIDRSNHDLPEVRILLEVFGRSVDWGTTGPYVCWGTIKVPLESDLGRPGGPTWADGRITSYQRFL
jgi:hypothetical protein